MIGLLQRVTHARVRVREELVGEIGAGLLVFVGVQKEDAQKQADRLLQRLLGYRVFADPQGKMNLGLRDVGGGLLLVPQFTLAADTRKGARPSFSSAAAPDRGRHLFDYLVERAQQDYPRVACGVFGADMQVELLNDGPVTFWLES